jgi:hypothetical protein
MKKWNIIKEESKFKKVIEYQDYVIFDMEHSIDRYKERISKDLTNYYNLLKKSIDWIIKNNNENIENRYIFLSFKHGFGIQVEWRKDRYSDGMAGFSATTFSKDEMKFVKYKDIQVFIENLMKKQKCSLKESRDIVNKGYARFEFEEDLQKEMNLCGFDFFVQDKKLNYTFELVEL